MALASIPSFSNLQVPTAAQMQTIPAALDTVSRLAAAWPAGTGPMRKPDTKVALLSPESIANATDTVIHWDTSEIDTDNVFGLLYSDTLQVYTAGWWWVEMQTAYQNVPGGANNTERNACICVNGTDNAHVVASTNTVQGINGNSRLQVSAYVHLAQFGTVYGRTYQSSGLAANLLPAASSSVAGAAWGTWLTMRWDAPY